MIPYRNTAGNSGVRAYEIVANGIRVQFAGGDIYLYTNTSAGAKNIKQMQQLAKSGNGLSTFISQHVKDRYERRR